MEAAEPGPGETNARGTPRFAQIVSAGRRLFLSPRFIVVPFFFLVVLVLVRYAQFGTARFLGWDSPYYVYLASLIDQIGPTTAIHQWSFPQFYVFLLWGLGHLLGNVDIAERILPFVWFAVLLVAYERITLRVSGDRGLANLALLLTPLTVGAVAIFASLNRTLMSYSLSLVVLILIAGSPPRLLRPTRANLILFLILLGIAGTELETYLVLCLAVALSFAFRRLLRDFVEALVMLALPILVVLPLSLTFVGGYLSSAAGLPEVTLSLDPYTASVFSAGSVVTVPFLFLGAWRAVRGAREGNRFAGVLVGWLMALAILFILFETRAVQLPPIRPLYILPTPPLLAMSVPEVEALWRRRAWAREPSGGA